MIIWNPWHGCHKVSEGCQHCYMYFLDGKRGIDTSKVYRTENFNLPVQRRRDGRFKLPSGMQLYVGLSTDFFVEEADEWRDEAWRIIRQRPDIVFRLLTKRASRIKDCLPKDWGDGYENVLLQVTTENQQRADERLPILLDIPAKHKGFMAAPFIGEVDVEQYLATGQVEEVLCGGENYDGARPCHYEWVKKLSDQCRKYDVTFDFIETGTVFVKEGKTYRIPEKRTQSLQAYKSGLSYKGKDIDFKLTNPEPGFFDIEAYSPFFREHCKTCGSRMTCNGSWTSQASPTSPSGSNCGNCE
ncbi:MAG: phage Gp37/Gp68 family protein [Bacteroidales bacterium]|nr:phage Gp37/Gp68 family protein [Bacteroidales bacterium]